MRWLVLVLLIANGVVWFASDFWLPGRVKAVAIDQMLPRVSTLKVASGPSGNASQPSPVAKKLKQAAESVAALEPIPVEQICVSLGWFETAEEARAAYGSIGSPGALRIISEKERALDPLHWVIIPPQPEDQALTLFNDLQRRGIDSYLVTRGENANAISLGLFQSKDAAGRVLKAKKRQNLNAVLANFPRNQISYALVFEVTSAIQIRAGDGQIGDYRKDFEMAEISRCEGIATPSENP